MNQPGIGSSLPAWGTQQLLLHSRLDGHVQEGHG